MGQEPTSSGHFSSSFPHGKELLFTTRPFNSHRNTYITSCLLPGKIKPLSGNQDNMYLYSRPSETHSERNGLVIRETRSGLSINRPCDDLLYKRIAKLSLRCSADCKL